MNKSIASKLIGPSWRVIASILLILPLCMTEIRASDLEDAQNVCRPIADSGEAACLTLENPEDQQRCISSILRAYNLCMCLQLPFNHPQRQDYCNSRRPTSIDSASDFLDEAEDIFGVF